MPWIISNSMLSFLSRDTDLRTLIITSRNVSITDLLESLLSLKMQKQACVVKLLQFADALPALTSNFSGADMQCLFLAEDFTNGRHIKSTPTSYTHSTGLCSKCTINLSCNCCAPGVHETKHTPLLLLPACHTPNTIGQPSEASADDHAELQTPIDELAATQPSGSGNCLDGDLSQAAIQTPG